MFIKTILLVLIAFFVIGCGEKPKPVVIKKIQKKKKIYKKEIISMVFETFGYKPENLQKKDLNEIMYINFIKMEKQNGK